MACQADPILAEGAFGQRIELATGDTSNLPRVAFIDEGCPGRAAAGGCPTDGSRRCRSLLIDSLAPLTTLKRSDTEASSSFGRECLEIRSAQGLFADPPDAEDLQSAVTQFRFRDLPLVRAPMTPDGSWTWTAGLDGNTTEPDGLFAGNLLNDFAVEIRAEVDGTANLSFNVEFPGTDRALADQGRAFLPLQFPGQLLGQLLGDVCDISGGTCEVGGFDLQGRANSGLERSIMVMDACIAAPPCGVQYELDPADPSVPGNCDILIGRGYEMGCNDASDATLGGRPASLVVATGIDGLVLFGDSVLRMFGDPAELTDCASVTLNDRACVEGRDATLYASGWPPAGADAGTEALWRIRVRSLALVPGLASSRGVDACVRAELRRDALHAQCSAYVAARQDTVSIEETFPPYRAPPNASGEVLSNAALAILGETEIAPSTSMGVAPADAVPDPSRWIPAVVIPPDHALPLAIRRDVAPEAIEPDGLLGSALFHETATVLDYTDESPGLRLSCLRPHEGNCLVAPACAEDTQPACCFGLPLALIAEFIQRGDSDICCPALSAADLAELQSEGFCLSTPPP